MHSGFKLEGWMGDDFVKGKLGNNWHLYDWNISYATGCDCD